MDENHLSNPPPSNLRPSEGKKKDILIPNDWETGIDTHILLTLCSKQMGIPQWLSSKESNWQCPGLEEEMATHSSIPAWTEEPGRLPSMGTKKGQKQLSD